MPSEQQHAVVQILARELKQRTRLENGWCWAWAGGVSFASGAAEQWFEGPIFVDRERADQSQARALISELEQTIRHDHPEILEPLRLSCVPTTRLEFAFALVESDFRIAAFVDREKMSRPGTDQRPARAWVSLGEIERVIGWTTREDRIWVRMFADASPDEEAARALGESWLAELRRHSPEVASLVTVVGESH